MTISPIWLRLSFPIIVFLGADYKTFCFAVWGPNMIQRGESVVVGCKC